jgi:hypothetical protein
MEKSSHSFQRRNQIKKNERHDSFSHEIDSQVLHPILISGPKIDRYKYSNHEVLLSCRFVISGCISYRGSSKAFTLLSEFLHIGSPHYSTIRLWVLRVGYYELMKPKEFRSDWVYIIDYTMTIGIEKCLVILGVPLSNLRENGFNLSLPCVNILHLSITKHANSQVVQNALSQTSDEAGVPIEIISDYGADVKKGIDEFCKKHSQVNFVYDVTHLSGCILKRIVESDNVWVELSGKIELCKHKTKQSIFSFLSPPCQRNKSRYLNLEGLIKWARQVKIYENKGDFSDIENEIRQNGYLVNRKRYRCPEPEILEKAVGIFTEKFGWVKQYYAHFEEYDLYMKVINKIKGEIGIHGLSKHILNKLERLFVEEELTQKAVSLKDELMQKIEQYLPKGSKETDTYLGRSDIIESLFGKYKYYCSEGSMMGLTQSVLIMGAVTSRMDQDTISNAMEFSTLKKIKDWTNINIGETTYAKRKKVMGLIDS